MLFEFGLPPNLNRLGIPQRSKESQKKKGKDEKLTCRP